MTDIIYPSDTSPLSCEDFNSNLTALLERENHTGFMECENISNLETCVNQLDSWIQLVDAISTLTTQYNNLNADLFGNGRLFSLIEQLESEIAAFTNNIDNAIANSAVFTQVQNATTDNTNNIQAIVDDEAVQNDNITANTTQANQNKDDIAALETTTQADIAALTQATSDANAVQDTEIANLETFDTNIQAEVTELKDVTIPAVEAEVDLLNQHYPEPDQLTTSVTSLKQVLVNTAFGTVWQDERFISNQTYTVPGDFATIQAAVDFLSNKYLREVVIEIDSGLFVEDVEFSGFVVLIGSLFIRGQGVSNTTVKGSFNFRAIGSNVKFENLTLQADTVPAQIGIELPNKINAVIDNLVIEGFAFGVFVGSNSTLAMANSLIRDCTFTGVQAALSSQVNLNATNITNCNLNISVFKSANVVLNNLTLADGTYGISCDASSSVDAVNVTINNMAISGTNVGGDGKFTNCLSQNNALDGFTASGNVQYIDTDSQNNSLNGFSSNGGRATLRNCNATGNTGSGVFSANNAYMLAEGTVSSNNLSFGYQAIVNSVIYAEGSQATATGNTFGAYNSNMSGQMDTTGSFIFFS